MARKEILVIESSFKNAVNIAEKDGPLSNINILTQIVAKIYNDSNPSQTITAAIALLRIKKWNIELKTKPGRRGRQPGITLSDEHKRAMQKGRNRRSKKFESNVDIQDGFQLMLKTVPERFHPLVEKSKNGSKSAALKLMCISCSGWQTKEVKDCTCIDCPLFAFRPYQNCNSDENVVEELDEEDNLSNVTEQEAA